MKLSDALRFSYERKAEHPTKSGPPIIASDFGIECYVPRPGSPSIHDEVVESWAGMSPGVRKLLLHSEKWRPIDPKPAMLILAEAACDWSIHEKSSNQQ